MGIYGAPQHRCLFNPAAATARQSLCLLELGCGDGYLSSQCIPRLSVDRYVGVDVTEPALDALRENFIELSGFDLEIKHQDMMRYLEQCQNQFDVIYAGYCIHHLSITEKQQLLEDALTCLKPRGEQLIYDVFLEPGQTRSAYLQKYSRAIYNDWTEINQEDLARIVSLITDSDFRKK